MADANREDFGTRLKRIDRHHRQLADGYVASVNHDGLIIAVPKRRRVRVPFAGIALVVVGIVAFKAVVLANLGAADYEARIASMAASENTISQVGAWIMQADPLTVQVSQMLAQFGN